MSEKLDTHMGGRQRFVLYTPGFRTCRSADSHHTNIPLLIRLVQKKRNEQERKGRRGTGRMRRQRRRRIRNLENDSKLRQTLPTRDSNCCGSHVVTLVEQPQFRHLLVPVAPADLHMPFQSCEPKVIKVVFTQPARPAHPSLSHYGAHPPAAPCLQRP